MKPSKLFGGVVLACAIFLLVYVIFQLVALGWFQNAGVVPIVIFIVVALYAALALIRITRNFFSQSEPKDKE